MVRRTRARGIAAGHRLYARPRRSDPARRVSPNQWHRPIPAAHPRSGSRPSAAWVARPSSRPWPSALPTTTRRIGRRPPPIIMSVKFIDSDALARSPRSFNLPQLAQARARTPCRPSDLVYELTTRGSAIARFAWTPKRPGAEIVAQCRAVHRGRASPASRCWPHSCCATCAAPPRRLRQANRGCGIWRMHDPLCGLPNRIFFGERLEP